MSKPTAEELERLGKLAAVHFEFTKKEKLAAFAALNRNAPKGGIVFAGDSITEGFPIHEMLRSQKPMFNRGISGDTTRDVLAKLRHLVLDLEPESVFLLIGTNDLGQGEQPPEIVKRVEEIVSRVQAALTAVRLFVQSVYPVNRNETANTAPFPAVGPRTNEAIRRINAGLRDLASKSNFTYIDLYGKLTGIDGQLDPEYTYDGLHLTVQGYEVVKDELQPHLGV